MVRVSLEQINWMVKQIGNSGILPHSFQAQSHRRAVTYTQKLPSDEHLIGLHACVFADKPKKDIYSFVGNFIRTTETGEPTVSTKNIWLLIFQLEVESLSVENTIWANTVVASGRIIGLVGYTGRETRSVMNTSAPSTKVGLIDDEINMLSKVSDSI